MLDGFLVIDSWSADVETASVRLVPAHFEEGQLEPVLTILISGLQNSDACAAALQQRKGELIVDLTVSDDAAAIHAEQDLEPMWLRGSKVSVSRGPYTTDDLRAFLREKDELLNSYMEESRAYRSALQSAEQLLSELIRRAEIKRGLTSRDSAWLDREVSLLQRVLRRVRER